MDALALRAPHRLTFLDAEGLEELVEVAQGDVHSLGNNRVNVTLRNFQTFFDAFGIKEGDPMFRPESERVHIW